LSNSKENGNSKLSVYWDLLLTKNINVDAFMHHPAKANSKENGNSKLSVYWDLLLTKNINVDASCINGGEDEPL
jgi:hypothetical protein